MKISDLLSLFRQGKATAKSHMKNLIEMAVVDGKFLEVELDLLRNIAKRNNISESQLMAIKNNPGGVQFEIPTDPHEKFEQLYDLVHMMSIDNDVHGEEMKLCNLFAIKFGYPREKASSLVDSIRMNIKNGQSTTETMRRVSMLMN